MKKNSAEAVLMRRIERRFAKGVVEYGLIEVRDAPAERDVIVEERRECLCCLSSIGVSPSAERNENLLCL